MKAIILFDGDCNFCDASVQFIIKRDSKAYFQFASIQSEIGQSYVEQFQLQSIDSMIVVKNNRAYTKSTAALIIAKQFSGMWKLLLLAKIIPLPIRDKLYDYVAKNRYKWFGKKEVCHLPTKEERERFL